MYCIYIQQITECIHVQSGVSVASLKFSYQRAAYGAFHSCGVNRVHYLCSCGHESCVF